MCTDTTAYVDPIGLLIEQQKVAPQFTLLLYDMEKTGVFSKSYKQRFRVIKQEAGRVVAKDTEWFPVSSSQYNQHESNIGMEVAAKDTAGNIKRVVGPPGYTNYIGNPQYGFWTEGINDTIMVKEKVIDSSTMLGRTAFYDYPTKTTVVVDGAVREEWEQWTTLPVNFEIDTIYAKANDFRKASGSQEQQALADTYYWQFYPNYDYVRALLQLPTGKVKLKEHQTAREQYRRGYSYYGILIMGGNRRYGTYSSYTRSNSTGRRFSRGGGGFGK